MRVEPGIEDKVAFLSRPEAYRDTRCVEIRQTHMSWVFLTETEAWKLKKPVCYPHLDFSTPAARRRHCESEVRLNRRLAPDVYRGVMPLTVDERGELRLDGRGAPVDWLVRMRRLPGGRMLDHAIAHHTVSSADVRRLGLVLASFYTGSSAVPITCARYRRDFERELAAARAELVKPDYGLDATRVEGIADAQVVLLRSHSALFDERVRGGKVVEAHGDLRPEHICLEQRPVIIDCLEFNRNFRILDAASELAFLSLECERLGAPHIGSMILTEYCQQTGDRPSPALLAFYKSYHACVRAKLAVWHLKDEGVHDGGKWTARAKQYLQLALSRSAAA